MKLCSSYELVESKACVLLEYLQVLAIEFVLLAIDFIPLANEFVPLAIELVASAL